MKKILLLLLIFIVPNFAFAEYLEVEQIKIYNNENRVSNVDKDGGNIEDIRPGDFLEFRIDLINNDDQNLEDVLIFVEIKDIDDGYDIEKDLSEFNMRPGEDLRKTITLTIPDNAEDDDYDIEIKIRAITYNSTEETVNVSYNLEIIRKKSDNFDLEDTLKNISLICQENILSNEEFKTIIIENTGSLGSVIKTNEENNQLNNDLKKCIGDLETIQSSITLKNNELNNKTKELDICKNQQQNKQNQINNLQEEQEKSSNNNSLYFFLAIGGAAAIYFYWKNKDKIGKGKLDFDGGKSANNKTFGFN